MGMKVKLSNSFLSPKHYLHSSCTHSPKTLSFRSPPNSDHVFKTLNSVYFASSHESSDDDDDYDEEDNEIESIIRGARSETSRLLFQPSLAKAISDSAESEMALPGRFSNLNLPDKENEDGDEDEDEDEEEDEEEVGPGPFKESVVMAMESEDPYMDFKRSMEEMVETHKLLKDWGSLEELLAWYLKVNGKKNHAYIVAAFVDLLVKFSSSSSSSSSSSCSGVLCSPKLNHEGCSNSGTSRSSSRSTSCACVCGDHDRRHRMGNKSTTSFSSAASSFSL